MCINKQTPAWNVYEKHLVTRGYLVITNVVRAVFPVKTFPGFMGGFTELVQTHLFIFSFVFILRFSILLAVRRLHIQSIVILESLHPVKIQTLLLVQLVLSTHILICI